MRLTAMDASFLYTETASGPMHISSIYILEGEIPFEEVFRHFAARMHLIPAFRRKVAFVPMNIGHPEWVDDPDFDLAFHVRHHALPYGSDITAGIDAAVTLNEPMLDREHSPWGAYVITGVPDRTLILTMIHHAMIDGASGIDLTTVIYDFERQPRRIEPPEHAWTADEPHSALMRFSDALRENLDRLQNASRRSWWPDSEQQRTLMRRAMEVMTDFVRRPVLTAPFNAGLVSPRRHARFLKTSFGEIREIRRALGGTINDVVLTVISEAVARYLAAHEERVDGQHMRIMCPVNVRTEDQAGALGNQVSAIFPVLPAWPMTPASRLAVVCAEMDRIKSAQDAQALTLMSETGSGIWPLAFAPTQVVGTPLDPSRLMAKMPLPVMPKLFGRPPNFGINFVCTNVPGVQVPQFLNGHQVLDTIGLLVLTGNIGFSLTILSYNKQLYFNFICEPRLLPDLEVMVGFAEETFKELLAHARAHISELSGSRGESAT